MRHAVLAATLAFGTALRPRGVVPVASRRVGKVVLKWLDKRRNSADATLQAADTEVWTPGAAERVQ